MYRQQLVPMRSKLFMPQQQSKTFNLRRWRWIGLALVAFCLSLVTKIFSAPPSSASPLVASTAISTHSDWVEAVTAQRMRQESPFAHSTDSDWVKAVMAQGTKQQAPSL